MTVGGKVFGSVLNSGLSCDRLPLFARVRGPSMDPLQVSSNGLTRAEPTWKACWRLWRVTAVVTAPRISIPALGNHPTTDATLETDEATSQHLWAKLVMRMSSVRFRQAAPANRRSEGIWRLGEAATVTVTAGLTAARVIKGRPGRVARRSLRR